MIDLVLADEVTERAGKRFKHGKKDKVYRWGSAPWLSYIGREIVQKFNLRPQGRSILIVSCIYSNNGHNSIQSIGLLNSIIDIFLLFILLIIIDLRAGKQFL